MLLHAPVVGMFVMEMGIAVDRVHDIEENIWSPRYSYFHSGVHIGLLILSFQIRSQRES